MTTVASRTFSVDNVTLNLPKIEIFYDNSTWFARITTYPDRIKYFGITTYTDSIKYFTDKDLKELCKSLRYENLITSDTMESLISSIQ